MHHFNIMANGQVFISDHTEIGLAVNDVEKKILQQKLDHVISLNVTPAGMRKMTK